MVAFEIVGGKKTEKNLAHSGAAREVGHPPRSFSFLPVFLRGDAQGATTKPHNLSIWSWCRGA